MKLLQYYQSSLRPVYWLLLGLFTLLVFSWLLPPMQSLKGIAGFLPLHTLMETIAIVVSMLVFGVCWGSYDKQRPSNLVLLASVFLGVALLDFLHTLSYTGMPDFITPSGADKGINFWLFARTLSALGLLAVAVLPWRPMRYKALRWVGLAATLSLVALVAWLGLLHQDWLPRTFINGQGLTPFKVTSEYVLIVLFLVSAFIFLLRMRTVQNYDVVGLFAAVIIMAMSEFFFTLYSSVTDIFNVLGHLYKVIAYGFIYKSIFIDNVRKPFQELQLANSALNTEIGHRIKAEQKLKLLNESLESRVLERTTELEQQSHHNEMILRTAIDGFFSADMTGRLHESNPAFCAMLGYSEAELEQMTIQDIEASESPDEVAKHMAKVIKLRHDRFDTSYRHKDGSLIEAEISVNLVESSNEMMFYAFARDITPRKMAERALREITHQLNEAQSLAHVGSWYLDEASNHVTWSTELYKMYGFDPALPPPPYTEHQKLFTPKSWQQLNTAIENTRETGLPYELELEFIRKNGRKGWMWVRGERQQNESGTVISLRGVAQDITQRKSVEKAIITAREEAERANAAKSEFLSRMSHELRTPLNAIIGFGQLLQTDSEHPLTQIQANNVGEILHGGEHLLELVNEVLDLSRIENGKLEITLEPVPARPLLESCIQQIQPVASKRNLIVSLEPCVSCTVRADAKRFREVLFNLLSNAVKYNREGGKILISCATRGDRLRFSVQDTGHGISADLLPRLFKPFERLESAYTGIDGTGIGLALAKKLVEGMHGEIGVDSVPGKGSTFWFELPVVASTGSTDDTASAAASPGKRQALLYVEDNPANLRLLQKILAKRKDIEFLSAENGNTGIEIATRDRPGLILLDINLPGLDGYQVLQKLKENPLTRSIPVIAVTANAMLHDVKRGMAAGFDDYLTKPIDLMKLNALLDTHFPDNPNGQELI